MAVVGHLHTHGDRPNTVETGLRAGLLAALRVGADQLDHDALKRLSGAALDAAEEHTGLLYGRRDLVSVVEVTAGPELVDFGGGYRPLPLYASDGDTAELQRWDTASSGWDPDELDEHPAADPLDRRELASGWWRLTAWQGDDAAGDDYIEAVHRIAAYLFDTDPAAHRGGRASNLVRLSGAAGLLGPYCRRGAWSVG